MALVCKRGLQRLALAPAPAPAPMNKARTPPPVVTLEIRVISSPVLIALFPAVPDGWLGGYRRPS